MNTLYFSITYNGQWKHCSWTGVVKDVGMLFIKMEFIPPLVRIYNYHFSWFKSVILIVLATWATLAVESL